MGQMTQEKKSAWNTRKVYVWQGFEVIIQGLPFGACE